MKKNWLVLKSLLAAVGVFVVLGVASSAWAAVNVTSTPNSVVVFEGESVAVTLSNSGSTTVDGSLKIGSSATASGAGKTYSTDAYSAELSSQTLSRYGGTATLTIEGTKATTGSQTLQVYNGSTKLCTVTIQVAAMSEYTFKGQTIKAYGETKLGTGSDPLILEFTNPDQGGRLVLPEGYEATADILAVGGGGSGAVARSGSGKGGSGGSASERSDVSMPSGRYSIVVGMGGEPVTGSYATDGKAGSESSIAGGASFETITGAGGAKGTTANPGGWDKESSITGSTVRYGAPGTARSSGQTVNSGAANTGNGGDGSYRTTTGAGGSGIVVVKITALDRVEYGAAQFMLTGDTLELPAPSAAWTASSKASGVATVSASGDAGDAPTVTATGAGTTQIIVDDGTVKTKYDVTVVKGTDVTLCVGDTVQFYFYNTASKTWSVYFNGSNTSGETGRWVESSTASASGRSFNTTFTAKTAGAADVVRVSDGTNDYWYKFTVLPKREFNWMEVASTNQLCTAKAENAWTISSSDDLIVGASCSPATASDRTTATLEGRGNGTATVTVQNYVNNTSGNRELGAIYKLATTVTGPTAAPVYLAPGASVSFVGTCASGQEVTPDQESDRGISVAVEKVDATHFKATFTCDEGATVGDEAMFEFACGGSTILASRATVIAPIRLKAGSVATDLASSATAEWSVGSADESVAVASSGSSGIGRYNASIRAVRGGLTTLWATNATLAYGSYGWTVSVFDENGQSVTMPVYSEMMVYAHNSSNTLYGAWLVSSAAPAVVTAEVADTTPTNAIAVRLTSYGVTNVTTVVVSNEYHTETFTVNVTKPTYTSAVSLGLGAKLDMTETYTQIDDIKFSKSGVVDYELADGKLFFTGANVGTTKVTVDGHSFFAVYDVTVAVQDITKSVSLAVNSEGSTTFEDVFGSIETLSVKSGDSVVNVERNGEKLTFSGKTEGSALVEVVGVYPGETEKLRVTYKVNVKSVTTGGVKEFKEGYLVYDKAVVKEEDGDLVFIFTNAAATDAFVMVPAPYMAVVDMLAVGGGGAGGTQVKNIGGGGGGAGGVSFKKNVMLTESEYNIVVGRGAEGGDPAAIMASAGSVGYASGVTMTIGGSVYQMISAVGGGGGGASTLGLKDGVKGGSGGGGTWFSYVDADGVYVNESGTGGSSSNGQGSNGGSPDVDHFDWGAGGGGAGGVGGADGTGGVGVVYDITGEEVTYSVGGAGGQYGVRAAGADGAGIGYGGEGGSGGPGGAGGDGIVVLRFKNLYSNVKVPIPTTNDVPCAITRRFIWEQDKTLVAFDTNRTVRASDGVQYRWSDVIDHIDGVMSKTCTGTPAAPEGLGNSTYIVYLKDGFSWDDGNEGTYGITGGQIFRWTVVENQDIIEATVEVSKTVSWQSDSNATVSIETKSTPQMSQMKTPKVLLLGTLCNYHYSGLADVVPRALSAAAENADVDYALMTGLKTSSGSKANVTVEGSLAKGESITKSEIATKLSAQGVTYTTYQHQALGAFYDYLYNIYNNPSLQSKYDYIIFEVDGSRLADAYTVNANESTVALFLKKYYDEKRVILVVDKEGSNEATWHDPVTGATVPYWVPNSLYDSGGAQNLTAARFQGLVGMFAPSHYLECIEAGMTGYNMANTKVTKSKTDYYGYVNRYEVQIDYEHADELVELLRQTIKATPYNIELKDKIVNPEKGLTIQSIDIVSCTNLVNGAASEDPDDWFPVMSYDIATGTVSYPAGCPITGYMTVDTVSNQVCACLSNINYAVCSRVETHVLDDGRFRSTDDAKYNVYTGEWEKDPNDGKAVIALKDDGGTLDLEAEGVTAMLWTFKTLDVTADAVNGVGSINGVGSGTHETKGYAEGSNPIVYYRGKPGYEISRLLVNDSPETITDGNRSHTVVDLTGVNQRVHVEYECYVGEYHAIDRVDEYNGLAHVFDVVYSEWGTNYGAVVKYSRTASDNMEDYLEADEFCALNTDLKNVGDHQLYARLFVEQLGYGVDENGKDDYDAVGWTYVTEPIEGHVTVTPRTVTIIPRSVLEFEGTPVDGIKWAGVKFENIVPGEQAFFPTNDLVTLENTVTYGTEYFQGNPEGQYRTWVEMSATNTLLKSVIYIRSLDPSDPEFDNYIVNYGEGVLNIRRGPMVFDGVEQRGWLDPENLDVYTGVNRVEKFYDGVETGLVIKVDAPDEDLQRDYGFELKYYAGDSIDGVDPEAWSFENPQFLHVGTNKVWYSAICTNLLAMEDAEQEKGFFPVTNYQYVIIKPQPIVLLSASAEKRFDGTPLTTNMVEVVKGRLGEGDTLQFECTGEQYGEGRSDNTFTWSITGVRNEGDYAVVTSNGVLNVLVGAMNIDGVNQPVDPRFPIESSECGAKSVVCDYTGEGTNIIVNVVRPDKEYGYTLLYTTNRNDASSWRSDFALTNACKDVAVYFALESEYYAPVTNFAFVTILPVEVVVTADDKTKRFGEADPAFTMTVGPTNSTASVAESLVNLVTNALTLVRAEAGEELGPHVITYADKLVTVADGNCKVYYEDGTLTITKNIIAVEEKEQSPLEPTEPNDPEDDGESATGVSNIVKDYDGTATNITIDVTKPTDPGEYTIFYRLPDGTWTTEAPSFTDAGTNDVWYAIEADGFESVTNHAYVTIHPIPVTLTADSASRPFDGTALTTNGFTVTSGAFIGDEGIESLTMTAASTITAVGSVANEIDPDSIVFKGGAKASNYTFTYIDGTLEITTAEAPEEDETDDPNGPFDPEDPKAPNPPENNDGVVQKLSDYDYVGVYDADAHTLDTNALWTAVNGQSWGGMTPSVSYSLDGTTWVDDPFEYTDVVATSFWYMVSAPNFSNYVHSVGVTITQRLVTVTAASATKDFDGTALTTNGFAVTSGSFAGEEGVVSATMDADSTITEVGVTNNTIASVTYKDNTKATNYLVSFEKGTLEVTTAEAPEDDDPDDPNGPFDPENPKAPNPPENNDGVVQKLSDYDYVGVYDADAHTLDTNALFETIATNDWHGVTPSVSYSLDGATWSEDPFLYTDVVATSFWYKVSADNFKDYIHSVGVTITNRPVTVTAASATWVYDTYEHTTNGFTTVGFVGEEGLQSVTMTSASKITEKGSVSNEIESVTFKANTKETNYTLTFKQGKLKVTDATIEIDGKPQDPDDPEEPNDPEDDGESATGVSNVVKDYDGTSTNITIDVTKPEDGYTVKYSTDGGTTWSEEEPAFTDAGTNDVWYAIEAPNFAPVTNHAYVTIHPIAVTITAASASKTYDGTALTTNGYTSAGFIAGEGITNATMTAASTITAVGVVSNAIASVDYAENTKASNYVVTFEKGALEILTASFPDPENSEDPDKDPEAGPFPGPDLEEPTTPPAQTNNADGTWSKLSDYDWIGVYDGAEHTFDVAALSNKLDSMSTELCNNPYELAYSLTGEAGSWQTDPFYFTDVTETPTSFWYRVAVPNFTNYIHAAGVVITQRVATVVSADGTWTYDGAAHVTNELATCEGFVAGETYTTNWVGTITTVGTTNNDFAIVWDGTAKFDNYTLVAATGVLEVVTAELPDPEDDDPEKDPEAGPFPGPDLEEPTTPPAPTNNVDGTWSKLSDYDIVTVYDGEEHTFDVAALSNKLANTQLYGNPYTLSYSMTGKGDWQTDPFYFTDVTETPTSFWYRVAVPNFTNYIHAAGVVITQRVVEVTSQDGTWTYDGKAHGTNEVYVSNGSFAAGEGVSTNGFPTITEVGTTNNEFSVIWDNADPENYSFSVVTGTLEIVQKDGGDGSVSFGDLPGTPYYYDGNGHEPKPTVHDDEVGEDLVEGVDFTYVWEENTNATETAKVIAVFTGNYTGAITNDFTILPRVVTLTSGSGEWTYDGTAHGTNEVVATAYADPNAGFVAGEGVTTNVTGAITTVGTRPNDFTWTFLPNTAATNYTVSVVTGELKIVTAPIPDPDPDPNDDPLAGPFDGPDFDDPTTPPAPTNNTDGTWSKLSDYDWIGVYDGEAHTYEAADLTNALSVLDFKGNSYALSYSLTGEAGSWQDDPFYFTDVTETPTSFWYRVAVDNFTNYIHAVGVVITQRVATVVSADGTWTYDGTAHVTNELATCEGFVAGETYTTNWVGTITTVGTTNNDFSIVWDGTADASNYTLVAATGVLEVVTAELPDPEDDDPEKDPEAGPFPGPDLEEPTTPPAPTNNTDGTWSKLSDYDVVTVYDGEEHTFDVAALSNKLDNTQLYGNPYTLSYSMTGKGDWQTDPFRFTDVTETPTSFWYRVAVDNFTNYIHAVGVVITQRVATVVSADGTWTYDGSAHVTNELATCEGFVAGETYTTNWVGTITTVGTTNNDFAIVWDGTADASNYTLVAATGVLEVVTAELPDPEDDDPEKDPEAGPFPGPDLEEPTTPPAPTNNTDGTWSKLSDYDVVTVYDGEEHTFDVAALSNKLDTLEFYGNPYTLSYSLTGEAGSWQDDPFRFTDVDETPTSFWYRVAVDNFTNYIHAAGVVITQRVATVVSADGTWTYDDAAHVTNELATCEGFVDGETYTTNWVGTITTVGTTNNDFAIVWDGTALESNYKLVAVTGVLEVVTAELPDPEDDDPEKDPEAGPFPGPDLEEPTTPPAPTNNTDGTWSKLSDYDVVTIYDGEEHTFDVAALSNKLDTLEFYGNPYTLSYSLTGEAGSWQDDPFRFTDVDATPTSFWYRVAVPNFTNYIHAAGVVITNRPITVTAASATKAFDGTALTTNGFEVVGLVDGEGIDSVEMTSGSTITAVGETSNVVAKLNWATGTKATNYSATYVEGTLSITSAEAPEEDETDDPNGPFDPENPKAPEPPENNDGEIEMLSDYDFVGVYDGEAHTIDTNALWEAIDGQEWYGVTPVVTYSLDGTDWFDDPFLYTDVVATSFWYKVSADNFSDYVHSVGVTITNRSATVTAASAEKRYDGMPLTTNGVAETSGFVAGEGVEPTAVMTPESTITDIGTTENVIESVTYLANTKASNYTVTFIPGTLLVYDSTIAVDGKEQDPDDLPTPNDPGDSGDSQTGVSNVVKLYDGVPTNITVNVTKPEEGYTVKYSTDGGETWTTEEPGIVDPGMTKVWYAIEADGFRAVTNYAWVTIRQTTFDVDSDEVWGGTFEAIDEIFSEHNEGLPDADGDGIPDGDLYVELTVKDRPVDDMTPEEAEEFDAIRELAEDRRVEALDLTLTKYLKDAEGRVLGQVDIPELDNTLTVEVDWLQEGRTCVEIYRNVDGVAEKLEPIDIASAGPDEEGYELDAATGKLRLKVRNFSMYAVGYRGAIVEPDEDAPAAVLQWRFDEFTSCYYGTLHLRNPDGWPNTIKNLRFGFKNRTLDNGVTVKLWRPEYNGSIWGEQTDEEEIIAGDPCEIEPLENRFRAVDRCDHESCVWGAATSDQSKWVDPKACELVVFTADGTKPTQNALDNLIVYVKYDSYGWTNEIAIAANQQVVDDYIPRKENASGKDDSAGGKGTSATTGEGGKSGEGADPVANEALLGGQSGDYDASGAKQTYFGSLIDADGGLAGTVEVKVGKPNKKTGKMSVTAKTVSLVGKKKTSFKATVVRPADATGALVVAMATKKGETLTAVLDGDSLTGEFKSGTSGCTIDGAKDAFADKKGARAIAAAACAGTWTGVFTSSDGGVSTFSVVITAKGKAKVSGTMSDGLKVSYSSTVQVGDGWCAVPVMVQKKKESFGFRLAFGLNGSGELSAVNASRWLDTGSEVSEMSGSVFGKPGLTAAEFKALQPVADGLSAPDAAKLSYKPKTGLFTGTLTWGKEKCKVSGAAVNGIGYGSVTVKSRGETIKVEVK